MNLLCRYQAVFNALKYKDVTKRQTRFGIAVVHVIAISQAWPVSLIVTMTEKQCTAGFGLPGDLGINFNKG